jgi:hypothetical protein
MAGRRSAENPAKNRIAPRTSTTMPLITQLTVTFVVWLKPSTHGEMISQIPNRALIPDSHFIGFTSKFHSSAFRLEVLCAR